MKRITISLFVAGLMLVAIPVWAATQEVTLTADNQFQAANVSVASGDTVRFVWNGGFHDVVFADGQSSGAPVGDVGATYSRTFSQAGTYAYVCSVHEALGMKGSVAVVAAGGGGNDTNTNTGSQTLPLTGPEDTILPVLGGLIMLTGAVLFRRVRKQA